MKLSFDMILNAIRSLLGTEKIKVKISLLSIVESIEYKNTYKHFIENVN